MTAAPPDRGPRDEVSVVLDSWQQQCCGGYVDLGSRVVWDVDVATDSAGWLASVLPADSDLVVMLHEEHHGSGSPTLSLTGRVTSIRTLHCNLELVSDPVTGTAYQSQPGSGRLATVQWCDPWGPEPRRDRGVAPVTAFRGWVVGVVPDAVSADAETAVARSTVWTP